jgi:hypothetical protein
VDDRVAKILQEHLNLASRQLDLLTLGLRVEPDCGLPSTEQEILIRIELLEAALHRHEVRKDA